MKIVFQNGHEKTLIQLLHFNNFKYFLWNRLYNFICFKIYFNFSSKSKIHITFFYRRIHFCIFAVLSRKFFCSKLIYLKQIKNFMISLRILYCFILISILDFYKVSFLNPKIFVLQKKYLLIERKLIWTKKRVKKKYLLDIYD